MKQIAKRDLPATEMIQEGSFGARSIGTHASTMTLYEDDKGHCFIEWDILDLERTEEIGLWFSADNTLEDYDGVMSLPAEAIQFLRDNGFTVPEDME